MTSYFFRKNPLSLRKLTIFVWAVVDLVRILLFDQDIDGSSTRHPYRSFVSTLCSTTARIFIDDERHFSLSRKVTQLCVGDKNFSEQIQIFEFIDRDVQIGACHDSSAQDPHVNLPEVNCILRPKSSVLSVMDVFCFCFTNIMNNHSRTVVLDAMMSFNSEWMVASINSPSFFYLSACSPKDRTDSIKHWPNSLNHRSEIHLYQAGDSVNIVSNSHASSTMILAWLLRIFAGYGHILTRCTAPVFVMNIVTQYFFVNKVELVSKHGEQTHFLIPWTC